MNLKLENQVVIITGATGGIGGSAVLMIVTSCTYRDKSNITAT